MGKQKSLAEDQPRKKKQKISHGNKTKQKHLPRINTELHGSKQNQKIRPGNITHLSEPDA